MSLDSLNPEQNPIAPTKTWLHGASSGRSIHTIEQFGGEDEDIAFVHTVNYLPYPVNNPDGLPTVKIGPWFGDFRYARTRQLHNEQALELMGRGHTTEKFEADSGRRVTVTFPSFDHVDEYRAEIYDGDPALEEQQKPLLIEWSPGGIIPIEFCMRAYRQHQRPVTSLVYPWLAMHDRYNHGVVTLTPPRFLAMTALLAEHNFHSNYPLLGPEDRKRVGNAIDDLQGPPMLDPGRPPTMFGTVAPDGGRTDAQQMTQAMLDALIYEPRVSAADVLGDDYVDELVDIFEDAKTRIIKFGEARS